MKGFRFFFVFVFLLTYNLLFSQGTKIISVEFHPVYAGMPLTGGYFKLGKKDSIQIEVLKLYLTNFVLLKNKKVIWREDNSFHLIDASSIKTCKIDLKVPLNMDYDEFKINLGVDSLTNSSGALGGDLDPTKGMYWTWQSGYINFKMEGKSNRCATRKNEFQFHLGGYQSPFNSLQSLVFKVTSTSKFTLIFDAAQFISALNLEVENQVMIPSIAANLLAQKAAAAFRIQE